MSMSRQMGWSLHPISPFCRSMMDHCMSLWGIPGWAFILDKNCQWAWLILAFNPHTHTHTHTHLQTLNTNSPFPALFPSLSLIHALIHPSLADQSIIDPTQEEGWGWGGEEDLLPTCKTIKVELITQPHLPQL